MIQSPVVSRRKSAASSRRTPLPMITFIPPIKERVWILLIHSKWQVALDYGQCVYSFPLQDHPIPPPATPAQKEEDQMQVVAAGQGYRFTIWGGNLPNPPTSDPEFSAFHQRFLLHWGPIITTLGYLQKLLLQFAVPAAVVNGERWKIYLVFEMQVCISIVLTIQIFQTCRSFSGIWTGIPSYGWGTRKHSWKHSRSHSDNI